MEISAIACNLINTENPIKMFKLISQRLESKQVEALIKILTCFLGLSESILWVESVSLDKVGFWVDPSDTNSKKRGKKQTSGYKRSKFP